MAPNNSEFADRRVVVTGGWAGIGRAAAKRFAAAGAQVVIVGRDRDAGDAVVDEISQQAGVARFVSVDLCTPEAVGELVTNTGDIDVLVNCAAYRPEPGPAVDTTADDLAVTLATNVSVPYLLSAAYGAKMGVGGAIVHLSSGNATLDQAGFAAYNISKAAVEALVRAFANELGHRGVRVNAVAPGPTYTP